MRDQPLWSWKSLHTHNPFSRIGTVHGNWSTIMGTKTDKDTKEPTHWPFLCSARIPSKKSRAICILVPVEFGAIPKPLPAVPIVLCNMPYGIYRFPPPTQRPNLLPLSCAMNCGRENTGTLFFSWHCLFFPFFHFDFYISVFFSFVFGNANGSRGGEGEVHRHGSSIGDSIMLLGPTFQ